MKESSDSPKTAEADKVRIQERVSYGVGNLTTMIGKQTPKSFSYQVYNIELGVISPIMIGNILFLSRLIDAFTDPFMGNVSDKTKSRWGRRRPWIVLGSALSSLCFALMWWVPRGWSDAAYLGYFGVLAITFYLALTVYTVPWYALGYELTPDYNERTRVQAVASYFVPLAALLVGWLYKITYLDFFDDRIEAIRWVGCAAALIMLVAGIVTAALTKERHMRQTDKKPEKQESAGPKKSFVANVKETWGCRPFRLLAYTMTLALLGNSMISAMGGYIIIYYLYAGDKATASTLIGWFSTVATVGTLILIPVISKLATRYGKKAVLMGTMWISFFGDLSKWFLHIPEAPYVALLIPLLNAPATAAIVMLLHSMIADICDYDELQYGTRREGMFGAVYAWLFKSGISLAFMLSGYAIAVTGFDQELGGDQAPGTLVGMRALYALIPAAAIAIGLYFINKYNLDEKRSREIRAELEERRGKI